MKLVRRRGEEKGNYDEGIPFISVITDGGWSKGSHKHSYNALSGAAVIIGKETKKLLYMDFQNKHCRTCVRAETKGVTPKEHDCTKNWEGTSQSMES